MYHFFVEPHQIGAEEIRIEGADVNHIRNVLRMKPGEEILISSREGGDYFCRVEELEPEYVSAKILEEWENKELPARIHLFQGLPKGDKMELIIQKAVELGAYRVVPVSMKRSVVKLDAKKADVDVGCRSIVGMRFLRAPRSSPSAALSRRWRRL